MITNMTSLEEEVSIMARNVKELMKSWTKREATRNAQIDFMLNKIKNVSWSNHTYGNPKQLDHQEQVEASTKGEKTLKDLQISIDGSISSNQLMEFIQDAIKDQVGSRIQSSIAYTKPYIERIDLMRMPTNYQMPIFQ